MATRGRGKERARQLAPAIPLARYEWDSAPQRDRDRAGNTGALFSFHCFYLKARYLSGTFLL